MDELHQYICQQACSRTGLPNIPLDSIGSIPPPPPSSTFIGERWLNEGPPSEPVVRVMFRCVSPPESASRHVLLHMKPSVTEESLAMKLCQIFEIPANGGVITKTMPKFMPGRDFLTIPGKVYTYAERFEGLGSSIAGFMEVTVVSVDAMGVFTKCGIRKTVGPAALRIIRQWCFG